MYFQAEAAVAASQLQIYGAMGFGTIIGWLVYYINRYRTGDVQFSDLATVIGIIGGAAILALFPEGTDLFGGYGVGLFIGFFSYFIVLNLQLARSKKFFVEWFLDGRSKYYGIVERVLIATFVISGQFILIPLAALPRLFLEKAKLFDKSLSPVYLFELFAGFILAVGIGIGLRGM